jgi:hypothetical protein
MVKIEIFKMRRGGVRRYLCAGWSLAGLAVTCFLFGCATAIHYTPLASADKNEIQQLQNNVYRVEYQVSPATSQEQLDEYLRRRCAELTVRAGYDLFRLSQRADMLGFSRRTSMTVTMYKGPMPVGATDLLDAKALLEGTSVNRSAEQ